MSFIHKLFRKTSNTHNGVQECKKETSTFEQLSEEGKLREVAAFIKANAEGGDAEYQYALGVMFATGQGPYGHGSHAQDIAQAKRWLEKSARQGHADAQNCLGQLYERTGESAIAVKYYSMAAKQNHVDGLINLAMAYGLGDGIPQNKEMAHKLFLKAGNQNDPFAQYIVGKNLFNGDGVEENVEEAFRWYWKAAERGESHAQYEIAMMYEVSGDMDMAKQWYMKSASQGNEKAQQKLCEL